MTFLDRFNEFLTTPTGAAVKAFVVFVLTFVLQYVVDYLNTGGDITKIWPVVVTASMAAVLAYFARSPLGRK